MTDDYLRTGAVAKILGLCPATVSKLFDAKALGGYVDGGGHRRVSRDSLLRYCEEREMRAAVDRLRCRSGVLLAVSADDAVTGPLWRQKDREVLVAQTWFEAGRLAQRVNPSVLVLDLAAGTAEARACARRYRLEPERPRLVCVTYGDEGNDLITLFDSSVPYGACADRLVPAALG